jgi:hypothetical protein
MAIRALSIVPGDPRLLYALTDGGVSRSDDGGMTWAATCSGGLVNGPWEYLRVAVSARSQQVVMVARPARPDLSLSPARTCWDLSIDRYDPGQGWQQSSQGLPVFVKKHDGG